jgi:hypothetical protein
MLFRINLEVLIILRKILIMINLMMNYNAVIRRFIILILIMILKIIKIKNGNLYEEFNKKLNFSHE